MAIFSPFFLGNIGQEIVFYNIQEQKNNFLGCKNKKYKKWKTKLYNGQFFFRQYRPGKCVLRYSNPWFWSKNGHFSISLFFKQYIGQQSVFYNILRQKKKISRQLKKQVKNSKNWGFSKGVHKWFWSKNGHFLNFFFRQYGLQKCVLRYSRTKKRLSRL